MTDFAAAFDRQLKILQVADAAAKAKGRLVGRYVTYSVADGQAYYKIVRTTAKSARVEWVDIGDGYRVLAWGDAATVSLAKILPLLAYRDRIAAMIEKTDNWWENQPLGAIVHYSNGFTQYVRGKIVVHNGQKQILPLALLGTWHQHDLVTRRPDGTVYRGFYAQKIANREPFQPNASNMVEYPEFKLRDAVDPRTLSPLSLEIPELAPAQAMLATVVQKRDAAIAALQVTLTGSAETDYTRLCAAFEQAMKLLQAN